MPYFTISKTFFLPSFDLDEKEQRKLDEFLLLLEDSGIGKIIESDTKVDHSKGGRWPYNPYRLCAAILYGFSKNFRSLRALEEAMKYDLRFIYLMEQQRPSYVTISKFLNNVVVKHYREIFISITSQILLKYKINVDDVFIDGTKFEAKSNKYKFVWKPSNFNKKLDEKIRNLLTLYFKIGDNKLTFTSKEIATYLSLLHNFVEDKNKIKISEIKQGKGHRYPKEFKDYKILESYLLKKLDYEEDFNICGQNRNSYYKTDRDATAMCLKSDYYSGLGSSMHAAYNVQIAVSKGIIMDFLVSQDRNDITTFIPFLKIFKNDYGYFPTNICADAGYGNLQNYQFLKDNDIGNYVKYSMWRKEIDLEHFQLFSFNENEELVCLNHKIAKKIDSSNRHPKYKGNSIYLIENCCRCRYKRICFGKIKDKKSKTRTFETNYYLWKFKNEAKENLLSKKGIEMRVNRSSQVEGAFGVIKQDMSFERFNRIHLSGANLEISLITIGYNLRKFFKLLDGKAKLDYWIAPPDLQDEKIKKVDLRKRELKKKRKKQPNEVAKKYKYKKGG